MKKSHKIFSFLFSVSSIFFVLVSRSPERLLRAQLWAEDGIVFLEPAYETPFFQNIFKSNLGYLQVLQRSGSEFAIVTGWYEATPFIMNGLALLISSIVISFFTTSLYAPLIPSKRLRFFFALVAAGGGMHHEILGNITNIHSYLSIVGIHLLTFFYFFEKKHFSILQTFAFSIGLMLIILSTPYFFIFTPFLLLFLLKPRPSSQRIIICVSLASVAAQILSYLLYQQHTPPALSQETNFSSNMFVMIMHERTIDVVFPVLSSLGVVLQRRVLFQKLIPPQLFSNVLAIGYEGVLTVMSVSVLVLSFFTQKFKTYGVYLWLTALSNVMILFIFRPVVLHGIADVHVLDSIHGGRYFYITYVIVLLFGFWSVSYRSRFEVLFTMLLFFQITTALLYYPSTIHFNDYYWKENADKLRELQPGEKIIVPLNPPGWGVELTKPNEK